ncbi:hypothetical protein [Nostoc sp.]|uniref:hypothetical protein n=1 Tax=Nostoc sp. TaxID=1180 RepID=UPI002FF7F478
MGIITNYVPCRGEEWKRGFLDTVKSKALWQPLNNRLPGFSICPISTVGTRKRLFAIHSHILNAIAENISLVVVCDRTPHGNLMLMPTGN